MKQPKRSRGIVAAVAAISFGFVGCGSSIEKPASQDRLNYELASAAMHAARTIIAKSNESNQTPKNGGQLNPEYYNFASKQTRACEADLIFKLGKAVSGVFIVSQSPTEDIIFVLSEEYRDPDWAVDEITVKPDGTSHTVMQKVNPSSRDLSGGFQPMNQAMTNAAVTELRMLITIPGLHAVSQSACLSALGPLQTQNPDASPLIFV